MNPPWFPTFAFLLDAIPRRLAALTTFTGGLVAVAAPVDDVSAVGVAGLAGIIVGGIVSIYKIYADTRSNQIHRDDCHERLKEVEARCERLYDAILTQQNGETLSHSLDALPPKPAKPAEPAEPAEPAKPGESKP